MLFMGLKNNNLILFFFVFQMLVLIISIFLLYASLNVFHESLVSVESLNMELRNHYINFVHSELNELEELKKLNLNSVDEFKPNKSFLLLSISSSIVAGIVVGFIAIAMQS